MRHGLEPMGGARPLAAPLLPRLLTIVAVAALALFCSRFPEHFEWRRAAVAAGEWWRLWTGHLVHGSAAHLGWDLGVFAALTLALGAPVALALLAPAITLGLPLAVPGVEHYHGLSALLHAWFAWLLVPLARAGGGRRGTRRWARLALAALLSKATFETATAGSLFTSTVDFGGPVLHASHLLGAVVGLLARLPKPPALPIRAARKS